MFFKKVVKNCQLSPHYFWFIRTKKFGIINLCGEKGKLKKIVGSRAIVNFDNYGVQNVPASLIKII
jgi:hypothetical protein